MDIVIKADLEHDGRITLNPLTAQKINLCFIKEAIIRFGFGIDEISVAINDQISVNEIYLSRSTIQKLKLPIYCTYELTYIQNEIIIGPYIGIAHSTTAEGFEKVFHKIDKYTSNYSQIKGVICVFSLEDMNKKSLTLNGYVYNPQNNAWVREKLPYPAIVYRKTRLSKNWRNYLLRIYGNKLFNIRPMDKWVAHERLVQFDQMRDILPPTILLKDKNDITDFLDGHQQIYVKPIDGNKGQGIYSFKRVGDEITVKSRDLDNDKELIFKCGDQALSTFIDGNFENQKFLIQKGLDIEINGTVIDFRISLDKDFNGNWNSFVFIGKQGSRESIVSNRSSGGEIKPAKEILTNLYGMSNEEAETVKSKLMEAAKKTIQYLEQSGGHYAKCGVDLALDKDSQIWLIEANIRNPNDDLGSYIGDNEALNKITLTNMLYLKSLAGFEKDTATLQNCFTEQIATNMLEEKRLKILLAGLVQGVGLRKFVKKIAKGLKLTGWVKNKESGVVEISIQGEENALNKFIKEVQAGNGKSEIKVLGTWEVSIRENYKKFTIKKDKIDSTTQ